MKFKKIITALLSAVTILSILTNTAGAESTQYSWFCKRNGTKQPSITKEEVLISKYGGFALDRSLSDDGEEKVIYLTFDAGYENGNIQRILNILGENEVPAAFFVLDNLILKNPSLINQMQNDGHLICNHTKNHKNINTMSKVEIKENLESLETLCMDKTNITMSKFFRFPEGRYSEYALKIVESLGYHTVFWSFAYDDWDNNRQYKPEDAMKKILDNTHNGAIILLHPTSRVNAEILPSLISAWKSMGYSFGNLNELCKV